MAIEIINEIKPLREALQEVRQRGLTIGLVPTMGALHEGHAELIRRAVRSSGFVVVSIFVNPIQFGPTEDFARYPRTLDADRELCSDNGASLVFHPDVETMYPQPNLTAVSVSKMDEPLCGSGRPGHFAGVCTVVAKLFNIVQPDVAIFGEKDGQQLRIIQRMIDDLNFPIQLIPVPTMREPDGLARSSRNRYLSAGERTNAPRIYAALQTVAAAIASKNRNVVELEQLLHQELSQIPNARIEYARIVDSLSLSDVTNVKEPVLIAVAVHLGTTRLIDNMTVGN